MTTDEQNYIDGYSVGERYCIRHQPTAQETYKIPCPVQWPEATENGFYDAIADYRRSMTK